MEKHISILGVLYIIFSCFHLLAAAIVFVILFGAGLLSGDPDAFTIVTIVASVIAFILVVTSLPGIIGGIGLLKMKQWARILILILGFFNLLAVPFGTVLAIYTFWVLLNKDTEQCFNHSQIIKTTDMPE